MMSLPLSFADAYARHVREGVRDSGHRPDRSGGVEDNEAAEAEDQLEPAADDAGDEDMASS